jgi:xanthine dehydrogenase YagR molybdenum-binding subunit
MLKDKLTRMTQAEIAAQPYIEAEASKGENPDAKKFSNYSFDAQFAEVRVNRDLGQIYVSRMTGVFAAGRILNAKTARSQFMSGIVWGISMALHENTSYDPRLCRIVNNFTGSKGIGEIGITGSSAAIANAIYHATGKRIRDLPITPDKLL